MSSFTLVEVLSKLGASISGTEESVAVNEDAISPLEIVRRAAFTGDSTLLSMKPQVLLTDTLSMGDLNLYDGSSDAAYKTTDFNIHSLPGLCVLGACIFESGRSKFAVSVLFREEDSTRGTDLPNVVIHGGGVEFAPLEAQLFDSAFDEDVWEKYLKQQSELAEYRQWRRNQAVLLRTGGVDKTPTFLMGDCNESNVWIRRLGITSLLFLRSPKDAAECELVKHRILQDLEVLPAATSQTREAADVCTSVGFELLLFAKNKFVSGIENVVPSEGRRLESAVRIAQVSIITQIAYWICSAARDPCFSNDDALFTGVQRVSQHRGVVADFEHKERAFVDAAAGHGLTQLELFVDNAFTLPSTIASMNRMYELSKITDTTDHQELIFHVAARIFGPSDQETVIDTCLRSYTPTMSRSGVLCSLARCIYANRGIVLISRRNDGQIENAILVSHDATTRLSRDALARVLLYPFLVPLVLDCEGVYELTFEEPEVVKKQACFLRQRLTCVECGDRACGVASQAAVTELKSQMSEILQASQEQMLILKDVQRKLNYVVERTAEQDNKEEDKTELSPLMLQLTCAHTTLEGFRKKHRAS